MRVLALGSRDPQVRLAQRMLNLSVTPHPPLREDSFFGAKTQTVLRRFQQDSGMPVSGIIDPRFWREQGVTLDIEHPVRLFPQPTNTSCWSAAATMLFGNMSVGPGRASLAGDGSLAVSDANLATFASGLGLRMEYPMSWSVAGLASLLRRGPLWVGGQQPSLHAVVIGGMWGDGDAITTCLLIYDPWPPGRGAVYSAFYGDRIADYPLMTMYILHK